MLQFTNSNWRLESLKDIEIDLYLAMASGVDLYLDLHEAEGTASLV